jgi:hypothetical protein
MELFDHGLMGAGGSRPWQYRTITPTSYAGALVRLYRASDPESVIRRLTEQLGVHHEALRNWIGHAEADAGERHTGPPAL